MSVIDKPGFYTSKAGKCEVKYVDDRFAFGYAGHDQAYGYSVWSASNGVNTVGGLSDFDILGPWFDKPKPIEAKAEADRIVFNLFARLCKHDIGAKCGCEDALRACLNNYARLVHLIEAEASHWDWTVAECRRAAFEAMIAPELLAQGMEKAAEMICLHSDCNFYIEDGRKLYDAIRASAKQTREGKG